MKNEKETIGFSLVGTLAPMTENPMEKRMEMPWKLGPCRDLEVSVK